MPAATGSLSIVAPSSLEARSSAEQRFLSELILWQAKRVFLSVTLQDLSPDSPEEPIAGETVLVLATSRQLLTGASLAAARQCLGSGNAVVLRAAHTIPRADMEMAHTLRGIEQREAELLALPLPPANADPPGAVLLSRETYLALRETGCIVPDPATAALTIDLDDLPVVHRGLYIQFSDYYGEERADILPFVPAGTRRILEIGCARGATGALLKARLGAVVTGVELNPVVASAAAARLDEVVVGDFESLELSGQFDAVVALELFEHLQDPLHFLRKARQLLAPGGRLILSTPNVGHWAIVDDLLAGRWDYLPTGLLCVTHLRFFTRSSLEMWLQMAGFTRYEIIPQRLPAPSEPVRRLTAAGGDPERLTTTGFYVLADR